MTTHQTQKNEAVLQTKTQKHKTHKYREDIQGKVEENSVFFFFFLEILVSEELNILRKDWIFFVFFLGPSGGRWNCG